MLNLVREYAQDQSLHTCDRFIARATVRHRTRNIRYFRYPTTVVFSINFHLHTQWLPKRHGIASSRFSGGWCAERSASAAAGSAVG